MKHGDKVIVARFYCGQGPSVCPLFNWGVGVVSIQDNLLTGPLGLVFYKKESQSFNNFSTISVGDFVCVPFSDKKEAELKADTSAISSEFDVWENITMKHTTKELDNIAEEWSGAYSADRCGREVSIEIIKALLGFGFNKEDAMEVYFSKNLRWFFDSQGDQVSKAEAKKKFTSYLKKNIQHIRSMFLTELNRKCSA